MCVCMPQVTKPTDTGRHQISWRWSYRQFQVAHMGSEKQTWVLWNGHWAISAVHLFLLRLLLLTAAILAGVKWNWKVFLISTSLMSSESKNVFVCLLAVLDSIFWQLLLINPFLIDCLVNFLELALSISHSLESLKKASTEESPRSN